MMKRNLVTIGVLLLAAFPTRAEVLQMELSIFGMD